MTKHNVFCDDIYVYIVNVISAPPSLRLDVCERDRRVSVLSNNSLGDIIMPWMINNSNTVRCISIRLQYEHFLNVFLVSKALLKKNRSSSTYIRLLLVRGRGRDSSRQTKCIIFLTTHICRNICFQFYNYYIFIVYNDVYIRIPT